MMFHGMLGNIDIYYVDSFCVIQLICKKKKIMRQNLQLISNAGGQSKTRSRSFLNSFCGASPEQQPGNYQEEPSLLG